MKAVLDTNVLVSAVLKEGTPPHRLLAAFRTGAFVAVTSDALLGELRSVLWRPRLRRIHGRSDRELEEFLHEFKANAELVQPEASLWAASRDPSDNRVLEAALTAQADYVVTGDGDLLDLQTFSGIQIVTPARFLAILQLDRL